MIIIVKIIIVIIINNGEIRKTIFSIISVWSLTVTEKVALKMPKLGASTQASETVSSASGIIEVRLTVTGVS